MQFFHLFSFVVVASYAAALPQPAELSGKYSNSADANLMSGLEARSYQPALNSYKESAILVSLKRRANGGSGSSLSSTSSSNEKFSSGFTDGEISSKNLASTIDKVGDNVPIFFKDGEKAAKKIGGRAGDLVEKYFKRNSYVSAALTQWLYTSLSKILHFIEASLGKDKYSKIEPELLGNLNGLKAKFKTELDAILDYTTKILNNDGSDIENVKTISRLFQNALVSRVELLWVLGAKLAGFEAGRTLDGQLAEVIASVNKFLEKQYGLHDEIMKALGAEPSQE
ncbi:hypothetical protein BASA50_004546 [Batrachochytrium salamandrivorans]|uniref:Uncharacterized protein n=1 Tax=Batrachochytrium salamandrivorans TaxID=1357716 RepID=A0ABQ8FFJ2_9FUNG|nr:hypothetical protein BASA50_004546 [Batrachochytrium salamandrivorans]KAH9244312.1 hypothetical protein BASA81_018297 [Batrachochytrium salamandrivorans]KAH9277020.1 hypothetical protein BASA83_000538 [Batrachochytrium salamandrivorans]